MKKKKSLFAAVFLITLLLTPMVSNAKLYQENDSNEIKLHAQEIQRNDMTVDQAVKRNYSQQYCINGYLDSVNDIDWFKINLKADQDNYLLFSHYNSTTNCSLVELYDNQGNLISNGAYYVYNGGGILKYFHTKYTGTYYVKVYSSSWNKKLNYRLQIGEPPYLCDSYNYKFGAINLGPSNMKWTGRANLTNEDLPNEAIVYCVDMGGVVPSAYKSMEFKNEYVPWKEITLNGFDTPGTQQYKLKQNWNIRYVGQKYRNRKVSPQITLYYIYPCTTENNKFWSFAWED